MKLHWPKVKIPDGFTDAESYLRQWYKKHYIVSYINNFISKPVMLD